MIKINELTPYSTIVFSSLLLVSLSSNAQDTTTNIFGKRTSCTESVFNNVPSTIGANYKCKPKPIINAIEDDSHPYPQKVTSVTQPVEVAEPKKISTVTTPKIELKNGTNSEPPPKIDISRQILRETELSLNAKEKEFTLGFNYAKNDSKSDLRVSRARVLTMPIEFNMGITDRLSFQTSLPLLYYSRESITTAHSSDTSDSAVGNLTLGFSYKARKESVKHSSITTSFSTSLPTKKSSSDYKNDISGSKFIGIRAGVSVSKSISPAILFFNFGYKHYLSQSNSQTERLPGDSISYGYGAGLSVNSVLTFSGRVAGTYSKKSKRSGEYLLGSNSEPVNLNLAINYKLDKKLMLSYGIQLGINNDANDSTTSLTLVWGL